MTGLEHGGDITEGERFRLPVGSVTDYAILLLDEAGQVASWNPGAERSRGYSEREIVGQPSSRFFTDEDRAAGMPERALRVAATEGHFEFEGWHVRKDGTRFWAHTVIDPIRNDTGKPMGFAMITHDLAVRKQTQEALRRSEERFRLLVQSVTDYAIYMLDAHGYVTNWNAGAMRIKGYAPEDIIGQHFSRFYTEEDRIAGLPELGLATAAREGRFEAEGWRVRNDGSRFWAHAIIDAIRDDDGRLLGFAKVTRDITERREAQLALEQAREAFFQAQKMEAIGKLTGGVAHDFNNLLAAVLGSLDLARKRLPAESDALRFINNAIMAAERGATLTQRMLAFARKQELKLEAVDTAALVHNMAELLQRTLGAQVTVDTCFPSTLPTVLADPVQLELAIINLAVNARDAMPGGGRIVISAKEAAVPADNAQGLAPGQYVCLAVADKGEGMDEKTLAQAIDPFFTTKGIGKGTGLGLPMVHGLAEQCGGRLVLKSRKGEGTTAELWLPAVAATATAAPQPPRLRAAPEAAPQGSLTVLAVDDDRLVLNYTVALLQELGHRVVEASSGKQALEILGRQPVDLLITDYLMPEMTGTQLAEIVRAGWPRLPVLLVTGYAELHPQKSPDLPRLHKPFQQEQLAAAVAELTEASRAPAPELQFVNR